MDKKIVETEILRSIGAYAIFVFPMVVAYGVTSDLSYAEKMLAVVGIVILLAIAIAYLVFIFRKSGLSYITYSDLDTIRIVGIVITLAGCFLGICLSIFELPSAVGIIFAGLMCYGVVALIIAGILHFRGSNKGRDHV